MKWDVWTQWNILIWAHSTFSHIDIPVAFGRLWVLSNVSIPLCWPRPNASLWRWMPWPFLWMRWGCLHRAFFRSYHVFSVTSLVPFKGQGKSRKSDLHNPPFEPLFFFPGGSKEGIRTPAETEGLCSDGAICRDLSSTKDSNRGDLMGIFRMEASHFLCHHLGEGGMGLGVDLLTWVGGRRGFWSPKFFFWGFHLANWKELESSGKSRFWSGFRIRRMIHIILSWGGSIWYPSTKNEKNNTSHQTGKGKKSIFKYTLRWGYVSSQGGPKKQIQLIGHHLSNAKRQMPSAVPQLLAPFLSLLEALDAERPRGSTSHDLEAEISHPKTWINGGKKKQKVWHHFAEGFFFK